MTYRLRHRHSYDPLSITHCLSLKAPRLTTPRQWHWAWPLHTATPSNSTSSLSIVPSAPTSSPVRHVWVSAIRSLTVSDDANYLAFVSQHGAVALSRPATDLPPSPVHTPPHHFPDSSSLDWCQVATCVAFFEISPSPSSPTRHILAVGYASGAIALFDSVTVRLLSVSKLPTTAPVRHLRFYPALHMHQSSQNESYPAASRNSGLFAVVGWSGLVAYLPTDEMLSLILQPAVVPDAHGAGWLIWHLSTQDAVLDAAACGSAEASVYDADETPDASSTAIRVVTVGINAPIVINHASPNPPFSARAAAARVATSFMSAARGFLFSRLTVEPTTSSAESDTDPLLSEPSSSLSQSVTGASSNIFTWVDDPVPYASLFKLGDSRASSIRKALSTSFHAGLKKRRPRTNAVNSTLLNRTQTAQGTTTTRSSSAPYSSKAISSAARSAAAANLAAATVKSSGNSIHVSADADVVRRVHSSMARDDISALLVRYAKNMRVVERVVAAPLPYGLVASCDTLGRIFIQDARDFCVLRVLKGYRDANIAWLAQQGEMPLLVVHAPRLDVVELHGPLEQKRREAFRVLPGTIMVQTTSYRPYCVFPDGRIFEVFTGSPSSISSQPLPSADSSKHILANDNESPVDAVETILPSLRKSLLDSENQGEEQAPDYELTGTFLEAVKSGRANRALECLDKVSDDAYKVAHLMATLVACTSHVRVDVHMALASKAGQISADLQNPDLVCRFDAHRRLAEAFQVVESEPIMVETSADRLRTSSRRGPRLIEDQLGFGLAELGMEQLNNGWKSTWHVPGHRVSTGRKKSGNMTDVGNDANRRVDEQDGINCEQFILSHCLVPTVDLEVESEYEILPRSDLSERESIWLAMAYFGKLLEIDSKNNLKIPTEGREHPSTSQIFSALAHYVGLSEAEITRQFVTFFLHAPLVPLLNTYVALHASALQCTISRIRMRFTSDVVDPIILDACETTTRVGNAVLLVRLCATHGDDEYYAERTWGFNVADEDETNQSLNPYAEALDRLNEALSFHRLVIGSKVTQDTRNLYTARRFSGRRGDGERMAVMELLNVEEFSRVIAFFGGHFSGVRRIGELKLTEAADITSTALESCRIKTASILGEQFYQSKINNAPQTENGMQIIPQYVMSWIFRPAEQDYEKQRSAQKDKGESTNFDLKIQRLTDMHAVLMSAHAYMLDSSEETVRCLQLADAISALIQSEKRRKVSKETENANHV